jgi:hypothetical protein
MKRLIQILLPAAVAATVLLPGCLPEESYESCKFQADQAQACSAAVGDEAKNNCVVTEHPQCSEGVCISYRNSSPFCTMECVDDSDCPSGGRCLDFAMKCTKPEDPSTCLHLCVKNSLIP